MFLFQVGDWRAGIENRGNERGNESEYTVYSIISVVLNINYGPSFKYILIRGNITCLNASALRRYMT